MDYQTLSNTNVSTQNTNSNNNVARGNEKMRPDGVEHFQTDTHVIPNINNATTVATALIPWAKKGMSTFDPLCAKTL